MALRHSESSALVDTSPQVAFAFIDDHALFSSHMNEPSWMMGGGRMSVGLDAAKGQAVGLCVDQMLKGAVKTFASPRPVAA